MMREKKYKEKSMALSQMIILILGTIGFVYIIGIGSMQVVSADSSSKIPDLSEGCGSDGSLCQSGTCAGNFCLPSAGEIITGVQATTGGLNILTDTPKPANSLDLATLNQLSGSEAAGPASGTGIPTAEVSTDWTAIGGTILKVAGQIALNAGIAAGVYWLVGLIKTNLLGIKPGTPWNYAATAFQFIAAGATFGALEMGSLVATFPSIAGALGTFWSSAVGGGVIGAAIAVVAFVLFYKTTKLNAVIVSCVPWQAPVGGADCGKCGQNGLPCSNYQCASLGQACQLENSQAGQGKPICVWVDPHDVTPPAITFLSSALPAGYTYSPLNAQYPGDTGVLIQSSLPSGDIPPFSPLTFGITTDKVSKCKIDLVRQDSYANMSYPMFGGIDGSEGMTGYNHTAIIPIFQPAQGSGASIQKSGVQNIYIRCQNANGYADVAAFDVQFVVDTTPDQTPPSIVGTSILNGAPIPYGTTSTNVGVYVNEPVSGCKWSHNNYAYSNMENNMTCANIMNVQGLYTGTFTCNANLDGLKNGVENDFYFACNDTSGNVDSQTYPYALIGTQPLAISSVTPTNGTLIKDSTQSVKVTLNVQTAAGQNQGMATCYYSATGNDADYHQFSNTVSYQSSQDLWLPTGAYTYYVKCIDLGGNAAYSSVNFNVQTDTQAPNVVRATHDGANLDIQTDETATCVYDIVDCNYQFSDGTPMSTTDGITQSTSWVAGRTYYIKCSDSFGNQPGPNDCSIVLSPSQV